MATTREQAIHEAGKVLALALATIREGESDVAA